MTFQKALITGATSGIGEALVALLAAKQIPMLLTGRNETKLEALATRGETFADDLLTHTRISDVLKQQAPDLVINCAGFAHYGHTHTLDEPLSVLDVNARATMELTLEAARAMIKKGKQGVILNVSSIAGELPMPGMAVYGAAKGALTLFSQAVDYELRPHGIRVLAACPGMVSTPFATRAAGKAVKTQGISPERAAHEIWRQIEKRKPKHIFPAKNRWMLWLVHHLLPRDLVHKRIQTSILERL